MAELFVPRGIQFAVLRSVAILGNRAYGTEIQEFLERNADKYLPAAQIYVALQRLQDRGLVQSNYEDAHLRTQGRKVHRRRVYSLTATGLRSLEAGLKLYGIPTPDGNGGGVFKKDGLSLHKRQRRTAAMVGNSVPRQTAANAEVFAGEL